MPRRPQANPADRVPTDKLAGLSEMEIEQRGGETDLWEFIDALDNSVSTVDIFRMARDGSRPHLERVALTMLLEDPYSFLRTSFGPGKYLLQFKDHEKRYKTAKIVDIAARESTPVNTPGAPAQNGNDQFMRDVVLAMIAAQKPMDLSFLTGVLKPPEAPNVAGMLTALVGVFTALNPPKAGSDDWLEKVKTVVSLARDLGDRGDGGGEDNLWTTVKEVGGKVASALFTPQPALGSGMVQAALPAAPLGSPAPQVHTAPEAAPPVTVAPAASFPQAELKTDADYRPLIEAGIAWLLPKAAADKDPEIYADYILDNVEEGPWQAISLAIGRGATFEMLIAGFPIISEQGPACVDWFHSLYDALHDGIHNPDDRGGGGGDGGDVAGHAGTGSPRPPTTPGANAGAPVGES